LGYLSVKPVPTGWHSNWSSDFAQANQGIFLIKSARYGLPKGVNISFNIWLVKDFWGRKN